MARGRGAGRNALSEGKIGELIRGNTEALKKQASIGGNVKPSDEKSQLPPGMLAFDLKYGGTFLPAPGATKEQVAFAQKLIDDYNKGLKQANAPAPAPAPAPTTTPTPATPTNPTTTALQNAQPNNTTPFSQEDMDLLKELQKDEAAKQAFKDWLQSRMDKSAFNSEQAMEKAKQDAWERYVRGLQSAAGAAKSAKNPANAKKAQKDPKSTEPKEEKEVQQAAQERPWWMSSGGGPRFIFGGNTQGSDVNPGGASEIAAKEFRSDLGAKALLKKRQARLAGGATPPTPPPPPTK